MLDLEERRSQPRAKLAAPAVVFLANDRFDCRVIDISAAGIALWCPLDSPPGHFLRLHFTFAPRGGIARWHEADGMIVRKTPSAGGAILGVQFAVVDDRVIRDVHEYVATAGPSPVRPLSSPARTREDLRVCSSLRPAPRRGATREDLDLQQLYREALREVAGGPQRARGTAKP